MQPKRSIAVALVAFLVAVSVPSVAAAADSLYWSNNNGTSISFASLAGSGGGNLLTSAVGPAGTAIDAVAGKIYFTNEGANTIFVANLDGTGAEKFNTGAATVQAPDGLAIDKATGTLYWANDAIPGKISFAKLDGSGGSDLNPGAATVNGPSGVAIDPASGKIYWANYNTPSISFANLDNSGGGGNLETAPATMAGPAGVALDLASGRIFWADYGAGNKISFARLDGSGGADLQTPGATVQGPWGVAIDPAAGRIYWANNTAGSLAFAKLDGSGGGPFATPAGAAVEGPAFPTLLEAPAGAGAPTISGGSAVKSTLKCSTGSWAPDLLGAQLYRAPVSFAYQWSRDGKDIGGGTSASIKATKAGLYVCRVTATNPAGSSTQASASHRVGAPVPKDFDTALLEGKFIYIRLKCAPRFKPQCLGNAAAISSRKHGVPISASVSAKQKPNKWKVAALRIKPKFVARVAKMAKHPNKKLLIVRQLVHSTRFKKGRPQSVLHIYRVRTAPR